MLPARPFHILTCSEDRDRVRNAPYQQMEEAKGLLLKVGDTIELCAETKQRMFGIVVQLFNMVGVRAGQQMQIAYEVELSVTNERVLFTVESRRVMWDYGPIKPGSMYESPLRRWTWRYSDLPICSRPECNKPSPLMCGGCAVNHYCSAKCLLLHASAHDRLCTRISV